MARGRRSLIASWGLIACGVAVAGVVIASRWYDGYSNVGAWWSLQIYSGRFVMASGWDTPITPNCGLRLNDPPSLSWTTRQPIARRLSVDARILTIGHYKAPSGAFWWMAEVMLWPFAVAFLSGGALMVVSGRKFTRRTKERQCLACGYNLAGLKAGAACPECGRNTDITVRA